MPGCSAGINAMADETGEITTDPVRIAKLLKDHWSGVFKKNPIDEEKLTTWLREEFGAHGSEGLPSARAWNLKRKHISKALRISGNSAPDRDKIPYRVWRSLGDLAVDTLFDAACELQVDNSRTLLAMAYGSSQEYGRHEFNIGLLCCLPKEAAGTPRSWRVLHAS